MDAAVVDQSRLRGLALVRAKGVRIRHVAGDIYAVPSASGKGGYVVDVAKSTCTCPAHEDGGGRCKHLWALAYHRRELPVPDDEIAVSDSPRRPTYPQNWPAYNRAQCNEKERVQILLRALCEGIEVPRQEGRGRPRLSLRDVVYGATMKVYGTMSGRRSTTDLRAYEKQGYVERAPAYNSLFRYVERPELTGLLKTLVEESAEPLKRFHSCCSDHFCPK